MAIFIIRERRREKRRNKAGDVVSDAWGRWKTIARLDRIADALALTNAVKVDAEHFEPRERVCIHKGEEIEGWST